MPVLSFLLAAAVLLVIGFFVFALLYEIFQRIRLSRMSPSLQIARADLGRYPHWEK
jgi:hypothetical protein